MKALLATAFVLLFSIVVLIIFSINLLFGVVISFCGIIYLVLAKYSDVAWRNDGEFRKRRHRKESTYIAYADGVTVRFETRIKPKPKRISSDFPEKKRRGSPSPMLRPRQKLYHH